MVESATSASRCKQGSCPINRRYTGPMRTLLWITGLAIAVIVAVLAAEERPGSPRPLVGTGAAGPALDEIRAEQIAAHLQFLSDDLLEGRAPSTRGGDLAARYLAAQLALLGFEPGGE